MYNQLGVYVTYRMYRQLGKKKNCIKQKRLPSHIILYQPLKYIHSIVEMYRIFRTVLRARPIELPSASPSGENRILFRCCQRTYPCITEGYVFRECQIACSLQTSFADFEEDQKQCSRQRKKQYSSLPPRHIFQCQSKVVAAIATILLYCSRPACSIFYSFRYASDSQSISFPQY